MKSPSRFKDPSFGVINVGGIENDKNDMRPKSKSKQFKNVSASKERSKPEDFTVFQGAKSKNPHVQSNFKNQSRKAGNGKGIYNIL